MKVAKTTRNRNGKQKNCFELFRKIIEELDRTQFTINEIIEEFCSSSNIKILNPEIKPVNFTSKDLNILKKLGLINYNKEGKYYEITEKGILMYENINNIYNEEDISSLQEFIFDNQNQDK